jgi:uncharacterized caspase-like protein
MTLLLNSQATKAGIRDAIFATAGRMGPDDFFVFFFSGHGTWGPDFPPVDEVDGLDEFLIPHDALEFSFANDIRDDELENWLGAVPGNNVCVIIDSCFSAGLFKAKDGVKFFFRPWHEGREILSTDGIAKDVLRPGYVVMTSSDDNESSVEASVLQNGVYTFFLVEGLMGPASADGSFISAEQGHNYAAPRSTAFYPEMHPQILDMHPGPYKLIIR